MIGLGFTVESGDGEANECPRKCDIPRISLNEDIAHNLKVFGIGDYLFVYLPIRDVFATYQMEAAFVFFCVVGAGRRFSLNEIDGLFCI